MLVSCSTHPPTLLVLHLTKPTSDLTRLINKLLYFIRILSWEIIIHSFQFFNSFIRRTANTQFTHGAWFSRCASPAAALPLHLRPRDKDAAKILLIFLIPNISRDEVKTCTSPRQPPVPCPVSPRQKDEVATQLTNIQMKWKKTNEWEKQKGRELLFVFIASTARRKHTTN